MWYFSMLYIVSLYHCMYVCCMFISLNINQSIILIIVVIAVIAMFV